VDWVTTRLRSALTVAFALGICGPAAAAQITTDRPCYETPSSGTVRVAITATGLDPAQFYTVTLDDRQVASGTTPGTGTVTAQVDVARLAARQNTVNHSVVVTQGANTRVVHANNRRPDDDARPLLGHRLCPAHAAPGRLRPRDQPDRARGAHAVHRAGDRPLRHDRDDDQAAAVCGESAPRDLAPAI
jgi:hypothetical protein